MIVSEEEARTKWCPFSPPQGFSDKCIASGCMAWQPAPESTGTNHGFCGMAYNSRALSLMQRLERWLDSD